tara:strand:- start:1044 stop:1502 length:459 start_codon:yes stop_codon:yes gene_type:complete
MEFVNFLDKVEIEIIKMVKQAGYSTEENTSLCLLSRKYAGFLKKKDKVVVICTDNAKKKEGYTMLRRNNSDTFDRTSRHIKRALRHEAIHVAQECNDGKLLDIKKNIKINPSKINALKGSKKISGEEEKERQAYILEDKPRLVKKELRKYCL